MTEYVILRAVNDNGWVEEKRVTARGQRAAVREALNSFKGAIDDTGRSYVAVPARSWQPVTVKVETRTQLKFQ